ncbi:MAG: hypothetical protein WAV41_03895 [Microgenomates group bacterium]
MQDLIRDISRFVFIGVLTTLLLVVALVEILLLNNNSAGNKPSKLAKAGSNVVLASSVDAADSSVLGVSERVVTDDARPLLIKRYLEKYKSPLAPYSELIFDLSKTYNFEYYWIVAIAQQESNLCKKIPENSHNCWGYGINSAGTLKFESYDIALRTYAEYLKRQYFDKGLNTPELIMKKYCPHSNGSWAYGVRQFIEEIENGKF